MNDNEQNQTPNNPDAADVAHHVMRALSVLDLFRDAVTRPNFKFD